MSDHTNCKHPKQFEQHYGTMPPESRRPSDMTWHFRCTICEEIAAKCAKLEADVARLTAAVDIAERGWNNQVRYSDAYQKRAEHAEAETDRLRAALVEIKEVSNAATAYIDQPYIVNEWINDIFHRASAALPAAPEMP